MRSLILDAVERKLGTLPRTFFSTEAAADQLGVNVGLARVLLRGMQRLADHANEHGCPQGAPYFCLDGQRPVTADEWSALRHTWNHHHAITNVWAVPPLRGDERFKGNGERSAPRVHNRGPNAAMHPNQKPLELMRRIIAAATAPQDVVWEPFGGLCSATVAAVEGGRYGYAAETVERLAQLAAKRLGSAKTAVTHTDSTTA